LHADRQTNMKKLITAFCSCANAPKIEKFMVTTNTSKNVKVTLLQALSLCTGRTAHTGSRGIALLFHDQRH